MSGRDDPREDPDPSKVPKIEANYSASPALDNIEEEGRCRNCVHFVNQARMCKVVEGDPGDIQPTGVCTEFFAEVLISADNDFTEEGSVRVSQFLEASGLQEWSAQEKEQFVRRLITRLRE